MMRHVTLAFLALPAANALTLQNTLVRPATHGLMLQPRLAHTAPVRFNPMAAKMAADAAADEVPSVAPSSASEEPTTSAMMQGFQKFSNIFTNLFPLWTALVAVVGLLSPGVFAGISTSYFTGLLGMLMLSMGITLSIDDFKRVAQRPGVVGLGFLMCYGLMPAMALGLSKVRASLELHTVCCCGGGRNGQISIG